MNTNNEFLEKRLAEYTAKMEAARNAGEYAEFQKWEFEVKNINTMIKLNSENGGGE